jgi:hypothetical protein
VFGRCCDDGKKDADYESAISRCQETLLRTVPADKRRSMGAAYGVAMHDETALAGAPLELPLDVRLAIRQALLGEVPLWVLKLHRGASLDHATAVVGTIVMENEDATQFSTAEVFVRLNKDTGAAVLLDSKTGKINVRVPPTAPKPYEESIPYAATLAGIACRILHKCAMGPVCTAMRAVAVGLQPAEKEVVLRLMQQE